MNTDHNLYRMSFGKAGTTTITGPTDPAITGTFSVLQVLADTVIDAIVDARETETSPLDGLTLLAGTTIYGLFTSVSLTSGTVRLYHNLP